MAQGSLIGSLIFDHRRHEWEAFKVRLDQYCIANNITKETDPKNIRRRAVLITSLSEETFTMSHNLVHPDSMENIDYDELLNRLDTYFSPKKVVFVERYKFYKSEQQPHESLEDWAARVRKLAKYCNFKNDLDTVMRDRFIFGLENETERERLFTEDESVLTFKKAVELAQAVRCTRVGAKRGGGNMIPFNSGAGIFGSGSSCFGGKASDANAFPTSGGASLFGSGGGGSLAFGKASGPSASAASASGANPVGAIASGGGTVANNVIPSSSGTRPGSTLSPKGFKPLF